MGQSVQKEDMLSVPSGGIADFYMSDDDIAVIEQEEAQKAFGSEGVAAFDTVAKKMASYGRFGDDRIVHVESGEIVVPRALIEQSPELKDSIFSHLREQGVEDPERYVVGSSANSLNPETGLPEFFLGKIVKGVKKAFKGVGKVLKKVAPVILPIALSMTPLGPIYGAAVGSGIGTLMQGGSIEDALKSAVIAGGTGAVFKGFTGPGTFGENVSAGFANPGARFSQLGQGMTGSESFFRPFDASTVASAPPAGSAEVVQTTMNPLDSPQDFAMTPQTGPNVPAGSTTTDPSFLDRTGDYMFRGGQSKADLLIKGEQAGAEYLAKMKDLGIPATEAGYNAAVATAQPGMLTKFGPSVALAGLGASAAGFFDTPEEDEPEFLTGADLLEQDPDKYKLPDEEIQYVAPYDPFVPQRPVFTAADGGVAEIFPRRTGGIMPDEGIAGEDSVRAMLMPGEFVMTTDAVKGLGNGNNDQGIRKMYDMMRGLEAKGRAMA
jgi:hypothetical protein